MFGINDYLRFLRHKEELDKLIIEHVLINKPKCLVCGFEYSNIKHIYNKLPIISHNIRKDYVLVCNDCRRSNKIKSSYRY